MLQRQLITTEKEKLTIVGFVIAVYDKIKSQICSKYTDIKSKVLVIIAGIKADILKVF
jgi:hypothetical protein